MKVSRGGRIIICPHRPGFESGALPSDDGGLAASGILRAMTELKNAILFIVHYFCKTPADCVDLGPDIP